MGSPAPLFHDTSWDNEVWPQVEDQLIISIISGLNAIKEREMNDIKEKDMTRYRRFTFLSPDYGIDANKKVFCQEINTNGFMIGETYHKFFLAQDETVAVMQLLGADDFPNTWQYLGFKHNSIHKFCNSWLGKLNTSRAQSVGNAKITFGKECNDVDKAVLNHFIDEEMHSTGWKRAFPPVESDFFGIEHTYDFWKLYSEHFKLDGGDGRISREPSRSDQLLWLFIAFRVEMTAGEFVDKDVLMSCKFCPRQPIPKNRDGTFKTSLDLDSAKVLRPWYFSQKQH